MATKIIIGTRNSKLAVWQSQYIAQCLQRRYPHLQVELREIMTKGDKILDVPLAKIGGKGLFTKELEVDMLENKIDIAVHSLKDMPTSLPEGLQIAAITKRIHSGDALVSNEFNSIDELPQGAIVGTSSLRRKAQLLSYRPDLEIHDLRGNVHTRLAKLDAGEYQAIILAVAGLKRLGFGERIKQILPKEICLPAVGQGALAIESRIQDEEVNSLLAGLQDSDTAIATTAERSFLATLEGGCQVPVGVYAEVLSAKELKVEGIIASIDGQKIYRDYIIGTPEEAINLGKALAEKLLAAGGLKIMQELGLCKNLD